MLASSAAWGLGVAAVGVTDTMLWAMITIGVVGFMSAFNMSMNRSIVQLQVTPDMRGRVMSIDMMSHGLMPLGILPISYIAETRDVQTAVIVSGLLLVAVTGILWLGLKQVRRIDRGYLDGYT